MSAGTPRVAMYGLFGTGNIGNEGSLAAVLSHVRDRHPRAGLTCFVAGADVVRREHDVPAVQLMTFRDTDGRAWPGKKLVKAASRLWDIPRTFAMMGEVDVLVVPGTGVLETRLVPTPWGLPYWLFVAALSCRLRRRTFALVGVGAEHAEHPVTRWFYRWTVRLADYCTFRDEESRDAVRSMGVKGRRGQVCPDVAFSLPTPEGAPVRPGHVVIGVMEYLGGRDNPARGAAALRVYVENMSALVTRLVDDGRSVTLVLGDLADRELVQDIDKRVRSMRPHLSAGSVSVSAATTLEEIMREMSEAEVVVASRFHNIVCALKMTKPTISLGYAGKNASLLQRFGLGEFTQPMDDFDVDRLVEQIAAVQQVQPSVAPAMKETLRRFEDDLADVFHALSSVLIDPVARQGPGPRRGSRRAASRASQ